MLSGPVDYEMYKIFRQQFDAATDKTLVVVELSTLGGDPAPETEQACYRSEEGDHDSRA